MAKAEKMNPSRLRALEILSEYKVMNAFAQAIAGIRNRTLRGLWEMDLATYHPYADNGNGGWKISRAGREYLKKRNKT